MDNRKNIDQSAVIWMVGLCVLWGTQSVMLKATSEFISPILQLSVRSGISAIMIAFIMMKKRIECDWSLDIWRPGLLVGFFFSIEFFLVSQALSYTSAGHVVVLLYTAPIFAALGLHLKIPSEKLSFVQWLGMGLGFFGIVIAFVGNGADTESLRSVLIGDLMALGGGVCWAATTIAIRTSKLSDAPAMQTLLLQLVSGFVVLLVLAIWMNQTHFSMNSKGILALSYQTVIISLGSYIAWFSLLRTYKASSLGVLSFLTPMYGVLFGVLFLNEVIEWRFLVAGAMVTVGILIVTLSKQLPKQALR